MKGNLRDAKAKRNHVLEKALHRCHTKNQKLMGDINAFVVKNLRDGHGVVNGNLRGINAKRKHTS